MDFTILDQTFVLGFVEPVFCLLHNIKIAVPEFVTFAAACFANTIHSK